MPIRDVTGNVTGGIGPILYVENSVTVNIPIVYAVEDGKTVLVYQETVDDKVYTPTDDTYYLYNRGVMSDVLGGFIFSDSENTTYSETSGYLALRLPKEKNADGVLTSSHTMDLTAYKAGYMEFEFVDPTTGTGSSSISGFYKFMITGPENGIYNFIGYGDTKIKVGRNEGFWADSVVKIFSSSNDVLSETEDIELRIYSIYITKT